MLEKNRAENILPGSVLTRFRTLLCALVVIAGLLEFMQGYCGAMVSCGGMTALVTLVVVFPITSKFTRIVAVVLCSTGLAVAAFSQNIKPWQLVGAFGEMSPLIALLAAVMLLSIALQMGRFADLFNRFYARARHLYQPYILSLLISYILCIFSLMGAVAPSYLLINENLKKLGLKDGIRFGSTGISRGYAMAVIVSPAAATVGIALKYSGLTWFQMIGPIFILSLAGLLTAFLVEPSWRDQAARLSFNAAQEVAATKSQEIEKTQGANGVFWRRLLAFFFLFVGIIGAISFFGNVLYFSSLNSIAMGCLLVTFAWGALSGNLQPVFAHTFSFFKNDILGLSDQIVLLTAAGFLTFTMEHSGKMEWLGHFIMEASGWIGTVGLLSLLPLIISLLALVGLHPFASSIIFAKALLLSPLHFSPLALAASLMSGMSMAYVVAPFSGMVLVLVSLTGKTPYEVGVKWNFSFVLTFLILTSVFIALATMHA
ncbi:MAG: hypothetical protein GX996_09415 [Firmicutes bacterium]|nr:hypothetical protein [Bacillota bacterium]